MKIIHTSQIGLVRSQNQDRFLVKQKGDVFALLVLDGVGGSNAGDVAAASIASDFSDLFDESFTCNSLPEVKDWCVSTFTKINGHLYQLSHQSNQFQGMSSTCIFVMLTPYGDFYINIGDSRLYMLDHRDELVQLSTDHSLVNDLIIKGTITVEEALTHPMRHAVTNALGIYRSLRYDLFDISLPYKRLLLCSDGLSGYVKHDIICQIIADETTTLEQKDELLIQAVNDSGAYDNFTYILVEDRHV